MMRLLLNTGGSRGLGQALCQQFEVRGDKTLELSRSAPYEYSIRTDLADLENSTLAVANAIASIDDSQLSELIVINNAGTLKPIGPNPSSHIKL
jgi:NAD(P)-dependent dehydrogenase (short-subunit alcohol dehydrogenase family)